MIELLVYRVIGDPVIYRAIGRSDPAIADQPIDKRLDDPMTPIARWPVPPDEEGGRALASPVDADE